ncbi:MAG: hypothetical protein IJR14_03895 [Synergistaceae bacterium]|nr:hypothetical protein [Synergistaceae bacterium]
MQREDFARFQQLMASAADVTVMPNGKALGRVTLALFDGLGAFPFEAVAEAVAAHCREERFFPMLADIVGRIEGAAEERALVAWALVRKAAARWGSWESVRFPCPAAHWAIDRMGGWRTVADLADGADRRTALDAERSFARWYALGEKAIAAGEEPPAYARGAMRDVRDAITGRILTGDAIAIAPEGTAETVAQLMGGVGP